VASAIGKVAAGLGFMSYYPITPATDEPFYLEAHPESGVRVVQVEDELAAVNMAIGAAAAGVPAALTTSGPGFSLMAEALSFAGMTETPLVVSLYQRGGPSTGLPTREEQADLLFALFAGHGEFPRAVLASATVEGMAEDAALAMALAWRFQLPVIHLADKNLAQTAKTVWPIPLSALPEAAPKRAREAGGAFPRYRLGAADGVSPFLPVGSPGAHYWITSDEHDEYGHITEDPELRVAMMEKRLQKTRALKAYLPPERTFRLFRPEAEAIVVGWGSVYEAAVAALDAVPGVGYLHLFFLDPFPEIAPYLEGKRVATLEQNATGLLARLLPVAPETRVTKFNGRPITIEETVAAFEAVAAGGAPARVVLTAGV
jgi:2-oxoglutarate ferredoxin oxidoreductase subunit alpha